MSEEPERSDAYYEVQVDRETLVLLGFGFVALLVAAFLVGRWTAPSAAADPDPVAMLDGRTGAEDEDLTAIEDQAEDVDGVPLFGGEPISAEGAPPIGAVPSEPLPEEASPEPVPAAKPGREAKPAAKPAPERPAASVEPIPIAAARGWVVQVSAVKSSRDAKALQSALEAKGWPVRVLRESGFSKVQVGPFAKRSEADAAERRLKREERVSTWVKRS